MNSQITLLEMNKKQTLALERTLILHIFCPELECNWQMGDMFAIELICRHTQQHQNQSKHIIKSLSHSLSLFVYHPRRPFKCAYSVYTSIQCKQSAA